MWHCDGRNQTNLWRFGLPCFLPSGKLTIKHEVVCLGKAVDHVCEIVGPLAKKEVAIKRNIDPHTPLIIGDFSRVVQVRICVSCTCSCFPHGVLLVEVQNIGWLCCDGRAAV